MCVCVFEMGGAGGGTIVATGTCIQAVAPQRTEFRPLLLKHGLDPAQYDRVSTTPLETRLINMTEFRPLLLKHA